MVDPKILVNTYERNCNYLHREVDGLTHEDSLLQIPSGRQLPELDRQWAHRLVALPGDERARHRANLDG
ncbi:MAG: hypothetical protein U0521_29425 [Anaerolineae bacterium]